MTREEHIQHHKELHNNLDKLVADYVSETNSSLEGLTVWKLIEWSHEQTTNPSDRIGQEDEKQNEQEVQVKQECN